MMYIEHTSLEDNLHQILTNRVPTSSSPSASEATAAIASSALLARVREAHNSASTTLQETSSSLAAQFQNHRHKSSTPNYFKTTAKEWIRRPEPNLLPLEHFNTADLKQDLRKLSKSTISAQVLENRHKQRRGEEEEEEQHEFVQVTDSDQTAQTENFAGEKYLQEEIDNCASTSHFAGDLRDRQQIASSVAAPAIVPILSPVQVDEDEEFEYVVTRVPKRKLQQSATCQTLVNNPALNRKVRRPVPAAIPIDFHSGIRSYNEHQLPPLQPLVTPKLRRPIPNLKSHTTDSEEYYKKHKVLNGYDSATAFCIEEENNCELYSDSESVEVASTGRSAYAYNNDFYNRQEAQMGLDILNKLKHLFNWHSSTNHYSTSTVPEEGKRKRRSDDCFAGESIGPTQIKYRKVENRFPKYIAARSEEDVNEFLAPFSYHNQQQNSQKYEKQYSLNNSAQSSRTVLEMSNRRSTSTDKPPLRKSIFSAPHISEQIIKNTVYADVEFSDDDEPILSKGFNIKPTKVASARCVPEVYNIPIKRTNERFKSSYQKPFPPPLIEPLTGSILQSSLIPRLETRRKPTYAETLSQNAGTGHALGSRNSKTSSGASTSESPRILNGYSSTSRTNYWPGQKCSILNQEMQSEEREKYQQLLEQVVPSVYSSNSVAQRRRSALLLGTAISSARSSPAVNKRSAGVGQPIFKRPPLSSTINLDDEDDDDNVTITGVSHIKTLRSPKAKPSTIIVDDDEISDIIDLGNEERHVLSACAKINKEKNTVTNLCESKIEKSKTADLPFVEPVNSLQERFKTSPHIKDNWLQNWQSKWYQRKKNRNDEVKETVKVTEKLTAERRAAEAEIQERLRKFQIVDPELLVVDDFEDAIEEPEFVEFTQEQKARINAAICGPLDQVLISKFNLNITRRDIHTLCGHNWLNDEVINFYMNLLTERGERKHETHGYPRVYAMNTFFVPRLMQAGHAGVKRWTRKVDIFSMEIIPVPVHVGGVHWCMAIIHLKNRSIKYYDSMGTPNPTVLKALEKYLKDESMDKRKQPFDTSGFLVESVQGVPRQMNGSDCGVFSCMFAEYITRNREITFSQQNMEYFRQKMVLEIVMGELLH